MGKKKNLILGICGGLLLIAIIALICLLLISRSDMTLNVKILADNIPTDEQLLDETIDPDTYDFGETLYDFDVEAEYAKEIYEYLGEIKDRAKSADTFNLSDDMIYIDLLFTFKDKTERVVIDNEGNAFFINDNGTYEFGFELNPILKVESTIHDLIPNYR